MEREYGRTGTAGEQAHKGSISTRIIRQSGIYAIGNMALKASGLLLAFLYLNPAYISVEAFGYFSLLIVTAQFGTVIVGLGLGPGLLKLMTDPAFGEEKQALPFTALATTVVAAALALALFFVLARPLAALLLDSAARAGLIYLLAIYMVLKAVGNVPLMVLRIQERAGWYMAALMAEMIVLLGAAFYLIVVRGMGLTGLMSAYAISAGVSTLILVGAILRRVSWRFERKLVRSLAAFGVPLVMAGLASLFLGAGDRYLLKWLTDEATVGLYEWAARLAGVLNLLLVQSFNLAFSVVGLKTLGEQQDSGHMHQRTLRHYVIWTGWAALGLSLIAYDLTRLLPADPFYLQAAPLVLLLALGFMAYGVYYIVVNVVYAAGRTQAISLNVMAAAVLNALLNLLFIPLLGALGAALATLCSYLALAFGAAYVARRDTQVEIPWGSIFIVMALAGGLYLVGQVSTDWSVAGRLSLRFVLLLAYPLLVVLVGLYSREELRNGRSWVRQQWAIINKTRSL